MRYVSSDLGVTLETLTGRGHTPNSRSTDYQQVIKQSVETQPKKGRISTLC